MSKTRRADEFRRRAEALVAGIGGNSEQERERARESIFTNRRSSSSDGGFSAPARLPTRCARLRD